MPMSLRPGFQEIRCDAYNDDPLRVGRVAGNMLDSNQLDSAAAMLKSVADPTRLRILFALTLEPLCVCELSALLAMSMPAVSHHLRILAEADLITVKKSGKFACYYLSGAANSEPIRSVLNSLSGLPVGAVA